MSDPNLTPEEIAGITDPLTQGAARIRYFRSLGCHVKTKPNGQPLVSRSEYDAVMSPHQRNTPAANGATILRPDWARVRALGRKAEG